VRELFTSEEETSPLVIFVRTSQLNFEEVEVETFRGA